MEQASALTKLFTLSLREPLTTHKCSQAYKLRETGLNAVFLNIVTYGMPPLNRSFLYLLFAFCILCLSCYLLKTNCQAGHLGQTERTLYTFTDTKANFIDMIV